MKFPLEVGPPRKLVTNMKEYLNFVNVHNGKKKAVYRSIYSFNDVNENWKPDYNSAIVDCLFFDFDDKSCNAYEECQRLHKKCLLQNLRHVVVMSGRGYHHYIFLKKNKLEYPKEAIRKGQQYFVDKLNLSIDKQVMGNVAQMARVPNTYHPKAKRFCIPLTKEQFEKGDDFIKQLAKKQNFVRNIVIGKELFDISKFDKEPENEFNFNTLHKNGQFSSSVGQAGEVNIKSCPPCIQQLLNKEDCGWKDRYLIILYFKEKGYLIEEVYKILEQHLSKHKFYHCIKEERQLQYLFRRNDLCFPSCDILKEEHFCPGDCKMKDKIVYK